MEWTLVEGSRSCHGSRWKFLHLLPRKLPFASIRFHLFPWKYIYFHLLPWKHNVCLLPWRLPDTSICFHLIPRKLPPTFMEVDRHPACLEVGQLPWKLPQRPWKEQTRSKNFHLPKQTQDYVEANGSHQTRSRCSWKSRDNWVEDCGSYTKSVEVSANK